MDEYQNAGTYTVGFNGAGLANGLYYYELKTDNFSHAGRMLLLK